MGVGDDQLHALQAAPYELADARPGDAVHTHAWIVDEAHADALGSRLLDHRYQRLLGRLARPKEGQKGGAG